MQRFLAWRNSAIPPALRDLIPALNYGQFLLALTLMTAIPYVIALFTDLERERGAGVYLLVGLQVVMLINVLAHITIAVFFGGYAPGVVTALLINLPFSIYLLRRALKEKWLSGRAMLLLGPIALAIHGLGLPALLLLSQRVVSSR